MSITITADQRDLLYSEILDRLSGIDDVRVAVEKEDYDAAQQLAATFSDDLRLVAEDLGWGESSPPRTFELTTPRDVLRRSLDRMRERVEAIDAGEEKERSALRDSQERNRLVIETCGRVLADLDGMGDSKCQRNEK